MGVRERIIEDAGKLFFREGIKRVTMDTVAHELGISKRTIYENFKDKTELLAAILQRNIDHQTAMVQEMERQTQNALEVMVAILKVVHTNINQINLVYFSDLERFYPKIWRSVFNTNREALIKNMTQLLDRGQREKWFRADINTSIVAKLFIEQMMLLHNSEVFSPQEYPRNELFETVFLNFIRGMATPKGIEFLEELLEQGR